MRVLVTGGAGFVGRHLCAALAAVGDEVVVADRHGDLRIDLAEGASLRAAIALARPHAIVHLAAQAFVPAATRDPLAAYDVNALGTARLFEAVRAEAASPPPLVVLASSAEVYGARAHDDAPLREDVAPSPATPYAASKVAAEAIALASMRTYGIPAIVARAFNHVGPGQDARFAIAGFAAQLAAIARGAKPILRVGNLAAERDFLDVRDVAAAYVRLVHAPHLAGEIFNVCSGEGRAIAQVLDELIAVSGLAVARETDSARMRPSDVPRFVGDPTKLARAVGRLPRRPLRETLRDTYAGALDALA